VSRKVPRYMVFPAKSDEDGKNWVVRDTKNAEKPGDGRIVRPFRVLANALKFARQKNRT
jgi:hypothetical protein